MLLGLVVLALGLGFLGTSETRLKNSANLAALAALEKFASLDRDSPYLDRTNQARDRASEILAANTMPGTQGPLGDLVHSGQPDTGGGVITFGTWHTKNPPGTSDPCGSIGKNYPCFVPNPDPSGALPTSTPVDAVLLQVHNQSGNPFVFRLAKLLGKENFTLHARSIAAIVPRCTAYLMDVGQSITWETHAKYLLGPGFNINNPCITGSGCFNGGGTPPPNCAQYTPTDPFTPYGCNPSGTGEFNCFAGCNPAKYISPIHEPQPVNFGLGAFLASQTPVNSAACAFPPPPSLSKEYYYWCNYPRLDDPRGANFQTRTGAPLTSVFPHYQADYELEDAFIGGSWQQLWIDKLYVPPLYLGDDPLYDGPQPFTRNFLAFNAGLRQVESGSVGGDLAMIMVFTGIIRDRVPATGLTNDLGFLIQLTNMDNRGKRYWNGLPVPGAEKVHPNFVDRGWAPYPGLGADSQSGMLPALYAAAQELHSQCPSNSKKSIILATDGMPNCYFSQIPNTNCLNVWGNYLAAKSQLLDTPIPNSTGGTSPPILDMLQEYEISLSVVLDGAHINPNFLNLPSNKPSCGTWNAGSGFATDDPSCYLNLQGAYAYGYGGFGAPTGPIADWGSYDENGTAAAPDVAFYRAGEPGWVFGEPMGLWSKLALETGGFFCPLLSVKRDSTGAPDVSAYENFFLDRGPDPSNQEACDAPCDTTLYTCSPCVLKSEYRNPSPGANVQKFATEFLSKGAQAAQCARYTVGLNPFTLVEEDSVIIP
jgi:hypothetical protein